MPVYVDKGRNRCGRMLTCHMVADTLEELHAMADAIGMRREWFQASASTPHYDVCRSRRARAIQLGAIELDRRQFVEVLRRIRGVRVG